MTAKSKTTKTRNSVLGSKSRAALKPKKARTPKKPCGYFDCPGCAECRQIRSAP